LLGKLAVDFAPEKPQFAIATPERSIPLCRYSLQLAQRRPEMRFRFAIGATVVSALALTACGTTPGERAVSGGLIGAGAGAAIGAATGNPATGAAIGAATGAAVGAVTDPCTLNLGDPWWQQHGGRAEYERRCGRPPP